MSIRTPQEQVSHDFTSYIGWPILLLAVYVLSLGPAERFYAGAQAPKPVIAFYTPLNWVSRHCTPIRHFLGWYVYGLWVRPAGTESVTGG